MDSRKRRFDATIDSHAAHHVRANSDDIHTTTSTAANTPVLTMWPNAAASTVTRTTNVFNASASSTSAAASFLNSSNSASNKTPRAPELDGSDSASKRLRHSRFPSRPAVNATTTSFGLTSFGADPPPRSSTSLLGADDITPDERYEAMAEGSQSLLEVLSISQQNTQECTQTLEESPSMCVMRLVLHPDVERALTREHKLALERLDLYRIELHRLHARVSLGRDCFHKVFDKRTSSIDPIKLSRVHCIVECATEPHSHTVGVYVTDKSTNGIRVDGVAIAKDKRYQLRDGQTITLLSSRTGTVLLAYVAEDPHVRAAAVRGSAAAVPASTSTTTRLLLHDERASAASGGASQLSQTYKLARDLQECTLGVLFASPLVGKDIHGKYHPIAELDVKREYSILKQSLFEASKYAKRSTIVASTTTTTSTSNGTSAAATAASATLYEFPRQINVCAKFANTENFRSIVTLGCRALHFSGHGDERHLYFEDGMGLVHPIPHNALQELFSAGRSREDATPLRLAFVSACSSAPLAHAFVACGIPHVIGVRTNQKIEDSAAIEFTRSFYLALATGKSVGASFSIAQQAVAKSPNIRGPVEVAEKFLLLPEDGDHSEIIFPLAAAECPSANVDHFGSVKLQRYPKLWFDDLPALCQGFCNRSVEVYKICLALLLTQSRITRLVTIGGEEGIGKTAVAHAVANYVGPRITREGGVRIFSVAKLAQDEQDAHVGMARRNIALSAMPKCRVLVQLQAAVKDHLSHQRTRAATAADSSSQQLLVVLDGCDYLLRSDVRRERFRAFLSDILTDNATLKIVLTARTSITADGAVAGHGERVYALARFTAKMAAKMLMSLVSRPIRLDELKRAQRPPPAGDGTTTETPVDKLELIACHPALLATLGIPKRIADLAGRLNEVLMDAIPGDDGGGGADMMMLE